MDTAFDKARRHFVEGVQHLEVGQFESAQTEFEAALELVPGRISTLFNLAVIRIKLGQPASALGLLEQVLEAAPDDIEAWSHRGIALASVGRPEEALACHDRALAVDGTRAMNWFHRGVALHALERHAEALQSFERAVALSPGHADSWLRHGQTLQLLNRNEQALASYDKALELDQGLVLAWTNRGDILRELQRADEAAMSYEKAIVNGANEPLHRYFLAALNRRALPATAPKQYVERLFDDYARTFDEHLVKVLRYQAHTVLVRNLQSLDRGPFGSALDLGCGTGLCGPLLQPIVEHIDGVDLSPRMIDKARELGTYERLERADITEHLESTDRRYDLVLAADVFIYIGDLEPVFRGVRRVLGDAGVFCFSVEPADTACDFMLLPSLRFAHSEPYLRTLAERHGYRVLRTLRHAVREDQLSPVPGLFVYLAAGARADHGAGRR